MIVTSKDSSMRNTLWLQRPLRSIPRKKLGCSNTWELHTILHVIYQWFTRNFRRFTTWFSIFFENIFAACQVDMRTRWLWHQVKETWNEKNSIPCWTMPRWKLVAGTHRLNHPIEKEHHLPSTIMFGFNMLTYSNWKVDGTVPTYWFIRTLYWSTFWYLCHLFWPSGTRVYFRFVNYASYTPKGVTVGTWKWRRPKGIFFCRGLLRRNKWRKYMCVREVSQRDEGHHN